MRMVFEDGERTALLTQLGLEENATDEQLSTAVTERLAQEQQQEEGRQQEPPPENEGDDFVVVDIASFARMQERDRIAAQVEEAAAIRDRDELIEEAIADGKFSPGRRDHYKARYDSDPEGTKALIGRLKKNTVPLELRGQDQPTDEVAQDAYPTEWAPEVAARQAQNAEGAKPSRVHGEV